LSPAFHAVYVARSPAAPFYDALAQNDSAVEAMGKDELKVIATGLVTQVRKSVTIDWTLRESARAKIKVMVKRILRKHGY
jgi:type I restriction enzyme R subunit